MDSLGEDCHLSQGELASFRPCLQFDKKEEEWTLWEKIVISAKVSWHPSDHAYNLIRRRSVIYKIKAVFSHLIVILNTKKTYF